jgi:phosphatidylglycerophosphate synthase
MRVWIDAGTMPEASRELRVFGLTLIERHLRALARLLKQQPARFTEIRIDGDPGPLPAALSRRLPLSLQPAEGPCGKRLAAYAASGDAPVLVLAGDSLVDPRLIGALADVGGSLVAQDDRERRRATVLRLEPAAAGAIPHAAGTIEEIGGALLAADAARSFGQDEFPGFIQVLRRTLPFYLFALHDREAAARCERFLFWSNYKGSTDFFTRYVYPPLVWLMVRPLAAARVHPNTVTLVSILMTFAAVPLFALGAFIPGLLLAYGMSVLDSVDGKLARLTFTDSRLGNVLDHGLDIVHPPLWYVAWAWGLAGGDLAAPVFAASLWMTGFYVADRLVLAVYRNLFKRGLHTHAPIDAWVRSFISRRNINLPLFTVGVLAGFGVEMFYVIVVWQIVTFIWHAGRTFWILAIEKARPGTAPARPAGS